jgi:alpha-glucuronidase
VPTPQPTGGHPAWLPSEAFRAVGSRRVLLSGPPGPLETVYDEVARAVQRFGGTVVRRAAADDARPGDADLLLGLIGEHPSTAARLVAGLPGDAAGELPAPGDEGFLLGRSDGTTVALAGTPAGLLYALFDVVRLGEAAFGPALSTAAHRPAMHRRMLDHWDNVAVHPVMGQVERGYAGGSIFWRDGRLAADAEVVRQYGRLLASCGINAVAVNNVNVHHVETTLLTERLHEVAAIAGMLRPYGIRVHLSVNFAAPVVLGALPTADPCDDRVRQWWAAATDRVYEAIPDFGGYVVKADSEGQPGPFGYGRSHADGANMLAAALAGHGGVVHWRAFVYNHHQDWRDRSTDRARAAYDNFVPLDGSFADNAILQVKNGPVDFQPREPVSPVLAAMPATRVAMEVQATQEYTGQQRHVCYLGPMWSEALSFRPRGPQGPTIGDIIASGGGMVAVSNVGDDPFWTGHPLAQANLYAFGRLAWEPTADPIAILDEWIGLTFAAAGAQMPRVRPTVHAVMDDSWRTYERLTAPLGVGFMVNPRGHYGPDVDGYEYSRWGTYHFADRDGIGVDRTRATGTGFTGQYPAPWSEIYESVSRCPDELLLFFHHVPYGHVLHSGSTVIQHIYDTHFAGVAEVEQMRQLWAELRDHVDPALHERVAERLDEQLGNARDWRDHINTYFFRKSGVPDAKGRRIY